jgi:pimeloyl-ACP methyl ester carboxylesterase
MNTEVGMTVLRDERIIDFQDSDPGGDGPVVLFVPGSFSTPAAWRPIQKLMPQRLPVCVDVSVRLWRHG